MSGFFTVHSFGCNSQYFLLWAKNKINELNKKPKNFLHFVNLKYDYNSAVFHSHFSYLKLTLRPCLVISCTDNKFIQNHSVFQENQKQTSSRHFTKPRRMSLLSRSASLCQTCLHL